MTAARDWLDMMAQNDRQEKIASADAAEPMQSTEKAEPTDPIDRTEPIEPMESSEPLEPIDSIESVDQSDQRELAMSGPLRGIGAEYDSFEVSHSTTARSGRGHRSAEQKFGGSAMACCWAGRTPRVRTCVLLGECGPCNLSATRWLARSSEPRRGSRTRRFASTP